MAARSTAPKDDDTTTPPADDTTTPPAGAGADDAPPAGDEPPADAPAPAPQPDTAPATVAPKRYATAAYAEGAPAPRTVYRATNPDGTPGKLTDELKPGLTGYVVAAKGDTITAAAAADLTR